MIERIVESLKKLELFFGIDENFLIEFAKKARIETHEAKEIVRRRSEKCEELLFLVEGEAVGLFTNSEGRVLQIDHMVAPKLLASAVVFSDDPKYPVDVETLKKSVFLSIDRDIFVSCLMKNERSLRNYLKYVSDAFLFITDRFYEIAMKNLVQKVCSYVLKLSEEQRSDLVVMDMSKEELSREFGVTRPALSRVFLELEKMGIIEAHGRKIKIKNGRYMKDHAQLYD
ncbi:MAG: Crp/Fnr family transcriptional regulator [Pseudothermotoga sp.]